MQAETLAITAIKARENTRHRARGLFEKVPGSAIWWIRYADSTGRIRREKAGTKSAALTLYRKRKTEALQRKKLPESLRAPMVSFAEIARDALQYSRVTKVPAAYRADVWHTETLLRWFRERTASEITPQEIERRLSELADEGRKPATVNRYRALLSLVYSLANRNGKVSVNPARLVRLRKENNARVRFLDDQEETNLRAKIREAFPNREPEFDLALHTGMRLSEQYRLAWGDVDLKRGMLTIPRSKHGEKRFIPLNSAARRALEIFGRSANASGLVCSPLAGPERRWFAEVVKLAGLANFHWHDLRHTFASRLVMAGVDLRTVQELMGHKAIAMTVRYSHLAPAHQREAVERLVRAASQSPQPTEADTHSQAPTDTKTSTSQIPPTAVEEGNRLQVQ